MPTTAIPDLAAAIKLRIASFTAVTALAGSRIYLTWPTNPDGTPALVAPPFVYAILIRPRVGGPGELPGGRMGRRVDICCYGPDARTSDLLWRTLHYHFCPPLGSGRQSSFRIMAAATQINSVAWEGGPTALVDPDAGNWPYTLATYILDVNQSPIGG